MLGAVVGLVLGTLLLLPLLFFGVASTSPGRWFGAAALAGSATGVLLPAQTLGALQLLLHFVWGFFAVLVQGVGIEPPASTPRWLMVAFAFGVLYAVALLLL